MLKLHFAFLMGLFFLLPACVLSDSTRDPVVMETTRPAATAVSPTTLPLPTQTADQSAIEPLITSPTAAGTAVVNNGYDGSRLYRPEAGSGAIAGIGEYGVSFQYDPYLAAGIQPQLVDAFTDDRGMNYLLPPQHLSFTFPNSYADADPVT